jgi:hypothetical protein
MGTRETIEMVEAKVAGKDVFVAERSTGMDLKIAGQVPLERALVRQDGQERLIVNDSDCITVKKGDIFYAPPIYRVG